MSETPANQYQVCPRCNGAGFVRETNGTLTCPDCHGRGLTLLLDNYRFVAELPERFAHGQVAGAQRRERWWPILRWVIVIATILLGVRIYQTATPIATPNTQVPSEVVLLTTDATKTAPAGQSILSPLIDDHGASQLLFWLLLCLDLYFLFLSVYTQTPPHTLADLRETNPHRRKQFHTESDGSIDILPYLTANARRAIEDAVILAEKIKMTAVTPDIFLATLVCGGKTALIIKRLEQDPDAACEYLIKDIAKQPTAPDKGVRIDPATRQVILGAFAEAWANGFGYVDIEDFLLVMAKTDGPAKDRLAELKLDYEQIRSIAYWMNEELAAIHQWQFWREQGRRRPKGYMNRAWTARPTPFLDSYSRDFTQLASLGNLPVVKVRDQEIEAVIRILSAGDRNNALVVGEPGVGKTSIVGAVAARMVEENVPEPLKDKRLVELDLAALVSGGASEKENLDHVLQEVKSAGNIILFIGHIESLVSNQGGLSAATLLEAASKSAQLQIIGTATYSDYHRYIESSPTFSQSFQKVDIVEVSEAAAVTILEEESPRIQSQYQVLLTYPAIAAAVSLSRRYIQDQVLPEKALAVLADACQRAAAAKSRFVTKEIVEQTIAERTHLPVQDLNQDERTKLQQLDTLLQQRVIGQPEAVTKVAEALRRARTGLKDEKRPIGSFLFVGPTGVGKTETAKSLAAIYFGDEKAMVRLDMSEYQDAKAVYGLIGAPAASSSDFTEGGALTQAVRERPYCLILLDEIEKAHPDVLNLFLQLLDDGRLTENTGRTVSYANTIIIATSNAGADQIVQMIEQGQSEREIAAHTTTLLAQSFKPEFLNRFDAVVTFRPLSPENVQTIASLMLKDVVAHLKEQGIDAEFAPDVIGYVSQIGFDARFGARPLRRAIQDHVETRLADLILNNTLKHGEHLVITAAMLGLENPSVQPAA